MSRIVTKKEVQELLRGNKVPPTVNEQGMESIKNTYLYSNITGNLSWQNNKEQQEGVYIRNLGIRLSWAYEKVGENLYKRRLYKDLDNELYQKINTNDTAIVLHNLRKFKREKESKINKKLNHFRIGVDGVGDRLGLEIYSEHVGRINDGRKKNARLKLLYKDIDGYELEKELMDKISVRDSPYVNTNSDENKVVFWLWEEHYFIWEDFLEFLMFYDKRLLREN